MWTADPELDYEVRVDSEPPVVATDQHRFEDLTPNAKYSFQVRTQLRQSGTYSEWSEKREIYTRPEFLASLTVSEEIPFLRNVTIELQIMEIDDVDNAKLQVYRVLGQDTNEVFVLSGQDIIDHTIFEDTNLPANSEVEYFCSINNSDNLSFVSDSLVFTTSQSPVSLEAGVLGFLNNSLLKRLTVRHTQPGFFRGF